MIEFIGIIGILAVTFLIYIFLVSPCNRNHQDLSLLKDAHIAHRGLHNMEKGIPENSLPAFENAIKKGHPIELDLHLTKDENVVVFHDDNALRACGVDKKICEMTLQEIKDLRLFGTHHQIPTLSECLSLVRGKVFLLIEYKVDLGNTKILCEKAEELLSKYKGKYLVQSFYPQVLYWYRSNRKDVCRGQLSASFYKKGFFKRLIGLQLANFLGRPDFVSFKYKDYPTISLKFVAFLGAVIIGWTFRSQTELSRYEDDFYGYIYENFEI